MSCKLMRQEGWKDYFGFEAVGDCFEEKVFNELISVEEFHEIVINIMVGEKHSDSYSDCCNWQLVDLDENIICDWTVDWANIQNFKDRYNGLDEDERNTLMAIESKFNNIFEEFNFSIKMYEEAKNEKI